MFGLESVLFVNYAFHDLFYGIVITTETVIKQVKLSSALLANITITSSFVISIFEDLVIYEGFLSIT